MDGWWRTFEWPLRMQTDLGAGLPHRLVPIVAMLLLLALAIAYLQFGDVSDLTGIVFLGVIPFAIGGLAVSAGRGDGRERLLPGCLAAPLLTIVAAVTAARFLDESFVCIAMVAAPWLVAGLGGMAVNLWFGAMRRRWERSEPAFYSVGWLILPLIGALTIDPAPREDVRTVSRSIILDVPADRAWPMVLSIEGVRPDEGRINFTQDVIGIPRPTAAKLVVRSGRLVRLAEWGENIRFEEQITRLVPRRELRWAFRFPDRSISQFTDRHIHPDSEILTVEAGGYRLERLGRDKSRLTLWTRYRQRVRLPVYTAWWGERFLGDIQANILAVVRNRATNRHVSRHLA